MLSRVETAAMCRCLLEGITDVLSQRIFWVMIERVESMRGELFVWFGFNFGLAFYAMGFYI